jgi:REP element-mobilizing transposase RayT
VLRLASMTVSYYRRNLPHWQPEECSVFITWRLYGSLPKGFTENIRKWNKEPGRQFQAADKKLDEALIGPRWLSDPEIAIYTENAIKRGVELGHYLLRAYVVMPNHVHALLDPLVSLRSLTSGIKGVSARYSNIKLERTGKPFWQDESFDHWIRNPGQFAGTKNYIENNPVKAGLCANPRDWPWSSAHR